MGDSFRARDISIKAQKKIMSKMASKSIVKTFVDDTYASILDNLYNLAKSYTGNKKISEKLVKNIIKIVVKVSITARNDLFSDEDLKVARKLQNKFLVIIKTVISFFEVEFSFDKNFLTKNVDDCRMLLKQVVSSHLTEKSLNRIDSIFDFFTDSTFLEEVFKKDSRHRPFLQSIINDMNKAVDAGDI